MSGREDRRRARRPAIAAGERPMPIYEFYCPDCHVIFQFLSKKVTTGKQPPCPACGRPKLEREVSLFAVTGKAGEDDGDGDFPVDEAAMERALASMEGELSALGEGAEEDPGQAARLMRRFADMTGMPMGEAMEEAMSRLEAGEDPDTIDEQLGDRLEEEAPFGPESAGKLPMMLGELRRAGRKPRRDPTMYEM